MRGCDGVEGGEDLSHRRTFTGLPTYAAVVQNVCVCVVKGQLHNP